MSRGPQGVGTALSVCCAALLVVLTMTAGAATPKKPPKPPAVDPTEGETHLTAGRFGRVTVYIPEGTPNSVAIFLSGDGGWNLGVISMAKALVDMGAVVIGVDIRQYLAGALSLGFCPDQDFSGAALCSGAGLHYSQGKKTDLIFEPAKTLQQPWIAFQGQQDQVCAPAPVDVFAAQTTNGQLVKLPLVGHGFRAPQQAAT
jgi:Bacterial virulence protein (VirJ)